MTTRSDIEDTRSEREAVTLPSPTAPRAFHGSHPCQGLYWKPAAASPRVAFIATHYNIDFSEHYLAPFLAERGFGFLGWNTRYRGAEDLFLFENALIDIGVGVRWLREERGVEVVVILGNSGGGSLMGAYQAEAVKPTLATSGSVADALAALASADLYVSLNAHPGRPDVLTNWLDPSVTDENDPLATDPALDPYGGDNRPPYTEDFIGRYRAAQRARNDRITNSARAELQRLNAAGVPDRIFPLFRTWADLRFIDPAIDPSTRRCPACYAGDPAAANRSPLGLGRANTLRTWLSMWSLEASRCRAEEQLPRVTLPALVIQSTGDTGVFPSDARAIHRLLGSADKELQLIPGEHYFEGDDRGRADVADRIAAWVERRAR